MYFIIFMFNYILQNCDNGFSDILVGISVCLPYCKKYNRKLLFDSTKSTYKIDFSKYVISSDETIIFDINKIKEILNNGVSYSDIIYRDCNLPQHDINENILM
jgi:hypothetical protein